MINIFYNKKNLNDTLVISVSNQVQSDIEMNDDYYAFYYEKELVGLNIFNFSKYMKLEEGFLYPTKEIIQTIKKITKIDLTKHIDKNFVVGKVKNAQKIGGTHLHWCDVIVSDDSVLKIVCGAPNVATGQFVVVAMVGTSMPHGIPILKGKIQGFESFGMLCSAKELNLKNKEKQEGIILLDETKYQIGSLFKEVFANSTKI